MGVRFPRNMFGVEIIYIRDHVARKVQAIVTNGRSVWALLSDGKVGTNDTDFFRYSYGKGSQREVHVAEVLWRLGKVKKAEYEKLVAAYDKKKKRENLSYAAGNVRDYAKQIGLTFTKDQQAQLTAAALSRCERRSS